MTTFIVNAETDFDLIRTQMCVGNGGAGDPRVQFLVDTNGELIPGGQLLSTSTPRMPSITIRNRTGNQPGMAYTM